MDIKINNVSFSYASNPDDLILHNIDLTINSGDFVCILGQSGCGKSTLLRLLAGLEMPTEGAVYMDGQLVTGADLNRGMVFQDYGLFPWKTAGENIMLALRQKFPHYSKTKRKEITIKSLQEVGLEPELFHKLPKELSGGMKQRCAIARAFSTDPLVLLMDEPFGALDAVTKARLQNLVLELWAKEEKKKTVVFVTHDVDEALLLANRIFVLGQKPSQVIFECSITKDPDLKRENLIENKQLMKTRNTLIRYLNQDVNKHIS